MAFYCDTSALTKLVVREPETPALRRWLKRTPRDLVSSDLTRTELMRAVRRTAPDRATAARTTFEAVTLVRARTQLFDAAGLVDPASLRSLDALHLATALDLGDDLQGMLVYDERLAAAARAAGIEVVAPT